MKLKPIFLALAAICSTATASTINLSSGPSNQRVFLSTLATPAANGLTVTLGIMTSDSDISTFLAFGSGVTKTTAFTGQMPGSISNSTSGATYKNLPIYMLIYNSAAPATDGAPNLSTATFAGLFKSTTTYPAFANGDSLSGNVTVGNATTTPWTALALTGFVTGIKQDAALLNPPASTAGAAYILGAAVPEPTSIALLGLFGLVGLRRKR